jgi:hypothetical protein
MEKTFENLHSKKVHLLLLVSTFSIQLQLFMPLLEGGQEFGAAMTVLAGGNVKYSSVAYHKQTAEEYGSGHWRK